VLSDEGVAEAGLDARPLEVGELGDASGTAGIGTVRIFLVLKGSFIGTDATLALPVWK
jgi:hypothetical protein